MVKNKVSKKPTMRDVAQKAGVTIGTVSHVINGTAPITDKTKKKVQKAIDELNYKPNSMARGLRRSKSKMIGLLIPDITNEYYSLIARIFTDLAYAEGYTVMLCSFQYNVDRQRLELDVLVDKSVDAIVLFGGGNDEKLLADVTKLGIPIILGDRSCTSKEYPSVEFDNRSMVKRTVDYLVGKGYKQIGIVTESLTMTNIRDRYDGYVDGMHNNGLVIDERFVFIEEKLQINKMNNGRIFMEEILKSRTREELPEVFITTSDLLAIGIMGALKEHGYKVPEDFGIVGYDDLSISAYSDPALTTVYQDPNKIGNAVWDIATQMLAKKTAYQPHLLLQQELIIRNSV